MAGRAQSLAPFAAVSAKLGALFCALLLLADCSVGSAKRHFLLAEKLWSDGKYEAAVGEFEKARAKDPAGALGLQALLRAANTQAFFLSQFSEAVKKFRSFADTSRDPDAAWEVEKTIGEILYQKMESYEPAIQHYKHMVDQRPTSTEVPEFKFYIAKSHFFLARFSEAIQLYEALIKSYPSSQWAEKAFYEIGVSHYTRGEQHPSGQGPGMEAYQDAIDTYQKFIKKYPQSPRVPEAKFGIASCLEEMDQLDAARAAYEEIKNTYPSPTVIIVKLARIKERQQQRSR